MIPWSPEQRIRHRAQFSIIEPSDSVSDLDYEARDLIYGSNLNVPDTYRLLVVAQIHGEIVAALWVSEDHEARCAVHVDHRRRNLGTCLLEAAAWWAANKEVQIWATPGSSSGRALLAWWTEVGMEGLDVRP